MKIDISDTTDLANDLRDIGRSDLAALVDGGRREAAEKIAFAIDDDEPDTFRSVLAAQVLAWGSGRDDLVITSNEIYCTCYRCAAEVLRRADAMARCSDHIAAKVAS